MYSSATYNAFNSLNDLHLPLFFLLAPVALLTVTVQDFLPSFTLTFQNFPSEVEDTLFILLKDTPLIPSFSCAIKLATFLVILTSFELFLQDYS